MSAVDKARERLLDAALAYDAAQRAARQADRAWDEAIFEKRRPLAERADSLIIAAERAIEVLRSAATLYAMAVKHETQGNVADSGR